MKVVDIKEQPESMICSKCLDGVTAAAQMKKNAIKSDSFFRKRTKRDEQALWTFMPPVCKIEEVEQVEDTIVEVVLMTKKEEEDDVDNVAPLLETVDYSDSDNRSDRDEVIKDDDEDFFGPPEPKKVSKPAQPTKSLSKKRSANDSRKGIFECDCGKVFTYKTSLSDHITMMHKEVSESEMFSCHVCTKKFKLKYQVDRHIKKIHPEVKTEPKSKARKVKGVKKPRKGRFECWCGKVLSYKAGLADHVLMHHTIVPESEMFPCQICGKKFKLKSYVERHVKTTHAENKSTSKAPCTVCGLFITKSFLRSHEAKHFKPKDAPQKARIYSCDLCGRSVSEKFYMQLHFERVHLKLKKQVFHFLIFFLRTICNQFSFNRFKCKQCSAAFVHGTLLDSHVRNIHLNIKPYVCRYCPKAFLRPGCRKIHERFVDFKNLISKIFI